MNEMNSDSTNVYFSENYPTTLMRAIYVRNFGVFKEVLRQFEITPVQWRVLANLHALDGQNINALAERSYTDRASLSRAVAVLEKAKLVKRIREDVDQRNVLVYLTKQGHEKFKQACPAVRKLDREFTKDFSPEEFAKLMEFLHRLKDYSYRTRSFDSVAAEE